jgi:hypothetical protein
MLTTDAPSYWILWAVAAAITLADALLARAGAALLYRVGPVVWRSGGLPDTPLPERLRITAWQTYYPMSLSQDVTLIREAVGPKSLNQFPALRLSFVRRRGCSMRVLEARLSIASLVTFVVIALTSLRFPILLGVFLIIGAAALSQRRGYQELAKAISGTETSGGPR